MLTGAIALRQDDFGRTVEPGAFYFPAVHDTLPGPHNPVIPKRRKNLKIPTGWLPNLDSRIWILFMGRLLSQLGSGFTLFYAPIFFVDQVGLSPTLVGLGIGSGSIAGVLGRILGGTWSDSPRFGRRWTLLFSAAVSALADVFLALTYNFPVFLIGNLLMGFGIGLYWPATEATVADLTTVEQRNEAYALTRLGDSLGVSMGVVLGGALIAVTGAYRALFVIDGISFVVFFGILYWAIAETRNPAYQSFPMLRGWAIVLSDRTMLVYTLVNTVLTTYLAYLTSTLPLYYTNFVPQNGNDGFSELTISYLFTWHIVLTAVVQLPIARATNRFSRPNVMILSSLLWGVGFLLIWLTGMFPAQGLWWAMLSLGVIAIATAVYLAAAAALVIELAPEALRGVYLSVNSLCWAVGYFVGPVVGGWAMDQSRAIANNFWLLTACSVLLCVVILRHLNVRIESRDLGG